MTKFYKPERNGIKTITEKILIEPEQEKEGAIVIPDIIRKTYDRGTVISVGEGVKEVAIGDKVIFRGGTSIKENDKDYIVIYQNDVLVVL